MTQNLRDALERERVRVDGRIDQLIESLASSAPEPFREAMRYVMLAGGKRLRPVLCMWTHDALGGDAHEACLDTGAALECLHSYTLVHDDLPCMDDDDYRRGQPSAHKQFGEATAVLVGDALQALCFEIVANLPDRHSTADAVANALSRTIAEAAGAKGVISGQVLDLDPSSVEASTAGVDSIHERKTAALIRASMLCGAILAGVGEPVLRRVGESGLEAGVAFQIIDDVLDVDTERDTLGKTPGKDAESGKRTYPSVIGVDASRASARDRIAAARERLQLPESRIDGLLGMLVERTR